MLYNPLQRKTNSLAMVTPTARPSLFPITYILTFIPRITQITENTSHRSQISSYPVHRKC